MNEETRIPPQVGGNVKLVSLFCDLGRNMVWLKMHEDFRGPSLINHVVSLTIMAPSFHYNTSAQSIELNQDDVWKLKAFLDQHVQAREQKETP